MKQNKLLYILVFSLIVVTSSCSSYLRYFQTAQASFNKAAENENTLKTTPDASVAILPETNYRMARTFIMKAMGDTKNEKETHDKTDLAKDGLLLNAYTIKALSEWKLGMYQEAIKTSRACQLTFGNDKSVQNQRDYIIIMALEPLIYNDSIEQYISSMNVKEAKTTLSDMDKASLENLKKGFQVIQSQRADLAADHPVQTYLLISQMSLAKNWKNLANRLQQQLRRGRSTELKAIETEMESTQTMLNTELVNCFKQFAELLGSTDHALYQTWKKAHADVAGI